MRGNLFIMEKIAKDRPSLENLLEGENLGVESLHPGGIKITRELANLSNVNAESILLDLASGTGESALFLTEEFHCNAADIDTSEYMVERALEKATERNLNVEFRELCECGGIVYVYPFCLFSSNPNAFKILTTSHGFITGCRFIRQDLGKIEIFTFLFQGLLIITPPPQPISK